MKEVTEKTTTEIIEAFNNPTNKEIAKNAVLDNPVEELGKDLLSFFRARLQSLKDYDDFENELKEELRRRIKEEPKEVTFSQLSNLLINIAEQKSLGSEGITSLLKPSTVPGSSNPILSSMTKRDKEIKGVEDTSNYSSDELAKVDYLYRLFKKLESEQ